MLFRSSTGSRVSATPIDQSSFDRFWHTSLVPTFEGVPEEMCFHLRLTKTSCFLSFPALLLAFSLAGCESPADVNTPEAKQQIAQRREENQAKEAEINAAINKRSQGGKGVVLKNIKANLKTQP
jgi:hypothetical protein